MLLQFTKSKKNFFTNLEPHTTTWNRIAKSYSEFAFD